MTSYVGPNVMTTSSRVGNYDWQTKTGLDPPYIGWMKGYCLVYKSYGLSPYYRSYYIIHPCTNIKAKDNILNILFFVSHHSQMMSCSL